MGTQKTSSYDITLLCKVVDNFGDIGVVYRLANALAEFPQFSLRLVVSDLSAFSKIEPKIDAQKNFQTLNGYVVFNWEADSVCQEEFQKRPPYFILECFQCGRPDWLEHLLFDKQFPHTVQIIMIDYLTAEDYAENFHLLPSITRSSRVKKINFMPGFTNKTGGLILDRNFYEHAQTNSNEGESLPPSRSPTVCSIPPSSGGLDTSSARQYNCFRSPHPPQRPTVLFFSYEKNVYPAVRALKTYNLSLTEKNLSVLLANGAGAASFKDAYEAETRSSGAKPFLLTELPFLPQNEWDCLIYKIPLLFIRGEDSLSRACLSGSPFIWNAYPQSDEYQLVKVNALLEKLRPFFAADVFSIIKKCWNLYNKGNNPTTCPATSPSENEADEELEKALTAFLFNAEKMREGFKNFSGFLIKNGDLTHNLMTFILKSTILHQ